MPRPNDPVATSFYGRAFEEIDQELLGLASACGADPFDPVVRDRVLHNDRSACPYASPLAFAKVRTLLMMHYAIEARAAEVLGGEAAGALVDGIDAHLRTRIAEVH